MMEFCSSLLFTFFFLRESCGWSRSNDSLKQIRIIFFCFCYYYFHFFYKTGREEGKYTHTHTHLDNRLFIQFY